MCPLHALASWLHFFFPYWLLAAVKSNCVFGIPFHWVIFCVLSHLNLLQNSPRHVSLLTPLAFHFGPTERLVSPKVIAQLAARWLQGALKGIRWMWARKSNSSLCVIPESVMKCKKVFQWCVFALCALSHRWGMQGIGGVPSVLLV